MIFKLVERNSALILALLAFVGGLVHLLPGFFVPIVSSIAFGPVSLQMVVGFLTIVFAVLVGYEST